VVDERLARWLAHIYETSASEIDCSLLQALLPAYVEHTLDLASHPLSDHQLAAVHTHLEHCPDCREEYQGLRKVLILESGGELPELDTILAHFEDKTEQPEPAPELTHCSQ
jgi:predicted anti-sigma-YlaC factor YlaD